MATLEFVKVTVGVLPANELLPHVEELVREGEGEWGVREGAWYKRRRRRRRYGTGKEEEWEGKGGKRRW